jgi:hypothetical protein
MRNKRFLVFLFAMFMLFCVLVLILPFLMLAGVFSGMAGN